MGPGSCLTNIKILYRNAITGCNKASLALAFVIIHIATCGVILGHPRDLLIDLLILLLVLPGVFLIQTSILESSFAPDKGAVSQQPALQPVQKPDPVLWMALILALLFSMNGMQWGRFECWNGDQMGLLPLREGWKPITYTKPPLLTFLTHLLVINPVAALERLMSNWTHQRQYYDEWRLFGARMLINLLFLGTVYQAYKMTLRYSGQYAARIVAMFLATSAGFITFNHFMTCDSALLFFMMLVFCNSMRIVDRGAVRDYVLAGLFTGAAFNLKYNGLAAGIAIPVAHYLSQRREKTIRGLLLDWRLFLGLAMVPIAIIATDPFMILDYHKFKSDFLYNYIVTPVYGGTRADPGYFRFIGELKHIFGVPGFILVLLLFIASLRRIIKRKGEPSLERAFVIVSLSVLGLYYAKFGSFTRTPSRFVLPVTPFLLMACAPCLSALYSSGERTRKKVMALLIPVFAYNAFCSYWVGERFKTDPRMGAVAWMEAHAKPAWRVESNEYSPHWAGFSKLGLAAIQATNWTADRAKDPQSYNIRMPFLDFEALNSKLATIYHDSDAVKDHVSKLTPSENYFSKAGLEFRNPDVITVTWLQFGMKDEPENWYYNHVIGEGSDYQLAFSQTSKEGSFWFYPRRIDFLDNTTMIYVRRDAAAQVQTR